MQHRDRTTSLSRRKLLQAAIAAGMLQLPAAARATTPSLLSRPIPSSGERLPVIGLGTSRTFDVGADAALFPQLKEVLAVFVAAGGTVVDTSPMYGRAEAVTGRLADELGVNPKLFVATKVWTPPQSLKMWSNVQQAGIEQMDESFRLLHRDRIDLMQIHNLEKWEEHLATLRSWKAAGRIRYIGITHSRDVAHADVERIIAAEQFDFLQINYSLAERAAADRLLPLCAERGVAVLVNRPFAKGGLFAATRGRDLPPWAADFGAASWGQFFLKYVLAHPAVTCVIPATRKVEHLRDNLQAGRGTLPDKAQQQAMADYIATL